MLTLLSCAAKHKSIQTLRGDSALFQQLCGATISTTNDISTNLVLDRTGSALSVRSERSFIHHEILDGKLQIYVPVEASQQRACYRSQLPQLLASIMGLGAAAAFNITNIISATLFDLDNILSEQDIPQVDWVTKPVLEILVEADQSADVPDFTGDESEGETLVDTTYGTRTPGATPSRRSRTPYNFYPDQFVETVRPTQYPDLIERVVRSAHRASARYLGEEPGAVEAHQHFDYKATFGAQDTVAWRRIGAAGEAYVRFSLDYPCTPDSVSRSTNCFPDSAYPSSPWRTGKVRSVASSPYRRTLLVSRTGLVAKPPIWFTQTALGHSPTI
jgi:hypothetical protein